MKSKFFKDTQGLCEYRCPPGQVLVCLRLNREACQQLLQEAARRGISTGAYVQLLLEQQKEEAQR